MGYVIAAREEAVDWMAEYPGFGEMRQYSEALGAEQVSFSWRLMPPSTGGRGSYGHRHPGQEEVYFVVSGTLTFKVGDDVFEAGAADGGADDRRGVLLGPQRHRRRRRAADLLHPARASRGPSSSRTSGPSERSRRRSAAFGAPRSSGSRSSSATTPSACSTLIARPTSADVRGPARDDARGAHGRVRRPREAVSPAPRHPLQQGQVAVQDRDLRPDRRPSGQRRRALRAAHRPPACSPAAATTGSARTSSSVIASAPRAAPARTSSGLLDELDAGGFDADRRELKTVPRGYPRDHPRARVLRRRCGCRRAAARAAKGRGISRERALAHVRRHLARPRAGQRLARPQRRRGRGRARAPVSDLTAQRAPRRRGARPGRPSRLRRPPAQRPARGPVARGRATRAPSSRRCSSPRRAQAAETGFALWWWRDRCDRRAGRLRRAQPRRGRRRAGRRGRLVDRPGALGRRARPRGGAGRARLGVRALRARADRLLHPARQRALAAGDGEARDGLRREFERRGLPHLLYEIRPG